MKIQNKVIVHIALMTMMALMLSVTSHGATVIKVKKNKPNLSPGTSFKIIKKIKLKNQKSIVKLQQYFEGIPVFDYFLTAEWSAGNLSQWNGRLLKDINKNIKSITPTISKEEAIKKLNKATNPKGKHIRHAKATLYVYADDPSEDKLAYLVSFTIYSNKPTRPTGFVDAKTGVVIEHWDGLTTKTATGPGGNEKTGKYQYGSDFDALQVSDDCKMSSANVHTVNLNHATSGGKVFVIDPCTDTPDNTVKEINGAFSPLNDAHAFGKVVFDLYKDWYDTAPLTSNLIMRVHYSNNYENAFWDGRQMTFGDGASRFYPLVGLDIVSHEVSHGFTEQNSGLIYRNQSGGINESFSDIAGEAAKYYFYSKNGGNNDWLVGGTIFKGGETEALRYFDDPEKDGLSIGHASKYVNGMDVHYSSGVFNRAFYLLAHKPNWDIHKAFDVFVLGNQLYWPSDSTFDIAACGLNKATEKLGYEIDDVVAVFDKVGVNATCVEPDAPVNIYNEEETTDISDVKNGKKYYFIDIPSHLRALSISTWNATGDADIYALKDTKPTLQKFNCRGFEKDNRKGTCLITEPTPGRYFILLHGYRDYSGLSMMAKFYK